MSLNITTTFKKINKINKSKRWATRRLKIDEKINMAPKKIVIKSFCFLKVIKLIDVFT
jgi:hypothetical protein